MAKRTLFAILIIGVALLISMKNLGVAEKKQVRLLHVQVDGESDKEVTGKIILTFDQDPGNLQEGRVSLQDTNLKVHRVAGEPHKRVLELYNQNFRDNEVRKLSFLKYEGEPDIEPSEKDLTLYQIDSYVNLISAELTRDETDKTTGYLDICFDIHPGVLDKRMAIFNVGNIELISTGRPNWIRYRVTGIVDTPGYEKRVEIAEDPPRKKFVKKKVPIVEASLGQRNFIEVDVSSNLLEQSLKSGNFGFVVDREGVTVEKVAVVGEKAILQLSEPYFINDPPRIDYRPSENESLHYDATQLNSEFEVVGKASVDHQGASITIQMDGTFETASYDKAIDDNAGFRAKVIKDTLLGKEVDLEIETVRINNNEITLHVASDQLDENSSVKVTYTPPDDPRKRPKIAKRVEGESLFRYQPLSAEEQEKREQFIAKIIEKRRTSPIVPKPNDDAAPDLKNPNAQDTPSGEQDPNKDKAGDSQADGTVSGSGSTSSSAGTSSSTGNSASGSTTQGLPPGTADGASSSEPNAGTSASGSAAQDTSPGAADGASNSGSNGSSSASAGTSSNGSTSSSASAAQGSSPGTADGGSNSGSNGSSSTSASTGQDTSPSNSDPNTSTSSSTSTSPSNSGSNGSSSSGGGTSSNGSSAQGSSLGAADGGSNSGSNGSTSASGSAAQDTSPGTADGGNNSGSNTSTSPSSSDSNAGTSSSASTGQTSPSNSGSNGNTSSSASTGQDTSPSNSDSNTSTSPSGSAAQGSSPGASDGASNSGSSGSSSTSSSKPNASPSGNQNASDSPSRNTDSTNVSVHNNKNGSGIRTADGERSKVRPDRASAQNVGVLAHIKVGDRQYTVYENHLATTRWMDVPPFIQDGRTMLPMRVIGEILGAKIQFDRYSKTAIFTQGEQSVSIRMGHDRMMVNGEKIALSTLPIEKNGRILLPVSDVQKALISSSGKVQILWEEQDKILRIEKRK